MKKEKEITLTRSQFFEAYSNALKEAYSHTRHVFLHDPISSQLNSEAFTLFMKNLGFKNLEDIPGEQRK